MRGSGRRRARRDIEGVVEILLFCLVDLLFNTARNRLDCWDYVLYLCLEPWAVTLRDFHIYKP